MISLSKKLLHCAKWGQVKFLLECYQRKVGKYLHIMKVPA